MSTLMVRFVAFPATQYDEVFSGRGQRWSSKRWCFHRSTIWPGR